MRGTIIPMQDCLFCKIVRRELHAEIIFEDDRTIAFLDIHPVSPGHTLVIPKEHATNIFDISPESWSHVSETVRKLASAIEEGVGANGINLMMNNRENAGQVIDHPHVHLIPRFPGDGLRHWPHTAYEEGEASRIAQAIRETLA